MRLCFAKDRLYLVEARRDDPPQGNRVLVLSLQGDILQAVTHPTEPTARFTSICCFDRKLLACYYYYTGGADMFGTRHRAEGVLALQGL